jgi:hypothetical protein
MREIEADECDEIEPCDMCGKDHPESQSHFNERTEAVLCDECYY